LFSSRESSEATACDGHRTCRYPTYAPWGNVEGSLKIARSGDGYAVILTPYAVEHWPRRSPLSLPDREAVAWFLQEIGTRPVRIIEIMDDLREADGVFLPMVIVTMEQRRTFGS
jgi:hypothetical protein